jgi:hypothetical protein
VALHPSNGTKLIASQTIYIKSEFNSHGFKLKTTTYCTSLPKKGLKYYVHAVFFSAVVKQDNREILDAVTNFRTIKEKYIYMIIFFLLGGKYTPFL